MISYWQIILTNTAVEVRGEERKKKNPKESTEQVKIENQYAFVLSHRCRNPFPHLGSQAASPPSDTLRLCADLWTWWRDPHILPWSSSFVFLLPISTALKTGAFLLLLLLLLSVGGSVSRWGLSVTYLYIHRHRVFLGASVDVICGLYTW